MYQIKYPEYKYGDIYPEGAPGKNPREFDPDDPRQIEYTDPFGQDLFDRVQIDTKGMDFLKQFMMNKMFA